MLPCIVRKMPWTDDFTIDHEARTVKLAPSDKNYPQSCNAALSALVQRTIDQDTFRVIHGQHSEPYPIMGANFPVSVERYASNLFGIISRGAHLTVFTKSSEDEVKIWVPRRAKHLFTYPGKLDTTVAGGVAAGEGPFECIVREAEEEASLPEQLVREHAKATGCISYIGIKDVKNGGDSGETGLIAADCVYVFDLEVDEDVICKQNDDEVEQFALMSVKEVKEALERAEFKTNSALVMIDFFIRHGIIKEEEEKDYTEIVARLHRRLPFPTAPNK
jgi:8-oxo-dGTP pyrophosphatase MutT (NUDIX family)